MHYSEYPEKSIEDFDVYEILGRGGFARVYRAKSLKTEQEVAIKIIDKKMTHHHGMTVRVRKEVELHSRLKHPSILELYTFFEDANYVYLVLEMCHNGELHRKIRENGSFTEEQARQYLKQIVDGLKYLHSYNILHRDLTLANLLLTKDMKVKIADFGLATQLEAGVEHFTMCGTPNYISPEVVNRSRQGLEADVWSVGCMLYTMLVGKAPFDTKEIKGTLNRVQVGQFNMPPDLSENAKDLIVGLLQTNPDKRLNLQQVSMHKFMQVKKVHELFQDLSITDSGIGSMNKSHSQIDPKNSLREHNKTNESSPCLCNKSSKILEYSSHALQQSVTKKNSCVNCKNDAPDSTIKSTTEKFGFHSLCTSSPPNSSSLLLKKTSNQVVNTNNQFISHQSKPPDHLNSELSVRNLSHISNTSSKIEPVQISPLNSKRLRPIRQKTRKAFLNILEDETVCIEFFKHPSNSKNDEALIKINEVMCIDPSGQSILIYNPQKMVPEDISKPVSLETGYKVSHFLLRSLPGKFIQKYELAKKFVDLVRSKTPKLTMYTNLAKCMLMENDSRPDFEILFHDNDKLQSESEPCPFYSIHFFGESETYQFFHHDGTNLVIDANSAVSKLSHSVNKWREYLNKCKSYCETILYQVGCVPETNLTSSMYPITIGRKIRIPDNHSKYFHSKLISAEHLPPSILDSLTEQLQLPDTRLSLVTSSNHLSEHTTSIFIPEIGWATQMANGELKVQFNDGCQLVISCNSSTIEKIKWFPSSTDSQHFSDPIVREFTKNDILPEEVHCKIELLPLFVKKLRNKISQSSWAIS